MKRDTRAAYRSRNKAMDGIVSAAVAEMKAEREATFKAARDAYEAEEAARTRLTRDDILGATAVRTRLYGWRLVRRINAKTVSVDSGYSWATLIPFDDVLAVTKATVKEK